MFLRGVSNTVHFPTFSIDIYYRVSHVNFSSTHFISSGSSSFFLSSWFFQTFWLLVFYRMSVFILLMSIKCIQRDSKIVLWVLVDLVYLVVVWYMECTYEDTPIVVRRFNVVETISNLLLVSFQYIFYTLHSVTKHRYPKQCESSYMNFWKLVFYRTSSWT